MPAHARCRPQRQLEWWFFIPHSKLEHTPPAWQCWLCYLRMGLSSSIAARCSMRRHPAFFFIRTQTSTQFQIMKASSCTGAKARPCTMGLRQARRMSCNCWSREEPTSLWQIQQGTRLKRSPYRTNMMIMLRCWGKVPKKSLIQITANNRFKKKKQIGIIVELMKRILMNSTKYRVR